MTTSNDNKQENKEYTFDQLKMYFRYPYKIEKYDSVWKIKQPLIKDIINIGEKSFYQNLYTFVGNTTMFRLNLWKAGIDWNKISDYELFRNMIKTVDSKITNIFFDDIDFKSFESFRTTDKENNSEIILYSQKHDMVLSEDIYLEMREYIRTLFNIFPKDEFARNKATKLAIIENDQTNIRLSQSQDGSDNQSTLLPLVSFALNHPGFKYKLKQIMNLGIYQFMDSIQRLQVYESTKAVYGGMYSGFCDMSKQIKADPDLLNFAKDLSHKENTSKEKNNNGN